MFFVKKFISIAMTASLLVIATDFVLAAGAPMVLTAACMVALWSCCIGFGCIMWECS